MTFWRRWRRRKWPLLRQAGDLVSTDFELHPVWVHCHVMDYDEPWHDDTDEETFRPWDAALPVDPAEAIFLVRTRFVLADGTPARGFSTPQAASEASGTARDLGTTQPTILTPAGAIMFWTGILVGSAADRSRAYGWLERTPEQLFPIRFAGEEGLGPRAPAVTIPGFCSIPDGETVRVDV